MAAKKERDGLAEHGSQLQMQYYVNRARHSLSEAILGKLPDLKAQTAWLQWVSPLKVAKYAEHWDRAFLVAVEREDLRDELRAWWPSGGAHWDALAIARDREGRHLGPVMVEAKSYPGEMKDKGGTKAGQTGSVKGEENLRRIKTALERTRAWLEISESNNEEWLHGPYYQAANRLAHLSFFRRPEIDVPAWLVHLYVVNDPIKPTSEQGWAEPIKTAAKALGTPGKAIPGFASFFLDAEPDARKFLRAPGRPESPANNA